MEEMARHIAAHLAPSDFRFWAGSPDHALLLAERDDAPAGYALLHHGAAAADDEARALVEATGWAGPYIELSKIYAHPLELGSGVASALMHGVVEMADALALAHGGPVPLPLWLGTNAGNARAQSFYRRHGFVVVGRRRYDVGGTMHDDVVMVRRG